MWKIKFFTDPIGQLKPWLNKMAESGYRLIDVKNFLYKFEKSEEKYYYDTQFIGANPYKVNKKYLDFIKSSGFKTFVAPLNQGQLSFGKVRLRMYMKGGKKVATRPGNYGKEILILESKADEKEKLLTSNVDIAAEYKDTRNAYTQGVLMLIFFLILDIYKMIKNGVSNVTLIAGIILIFLTIFYSKMLLNANSSYKYYKNKSEIREID